MHSNKRKTPASKGLSAFAQLERDKEAINGLNEKDLKHLETLADDGAKTAYLNERLEKNRQEMSTIVPGKGHTSIGLKGFLDGREKFLTGLVDKYKSPNSPTTEGYNGGEDWLSTKEKLFHDFFEQFKADYFKEMAETGDSVSDKSFTSGAIYTRVWAEYQKFLNDNSVAHIPTLKGNIEAEWTRKRKVKTFNEVFEEFTKEYTLEQKREIISRMAKIEAYSKYEPFLYYEQQKIINPEKVSAPNVTPLKKDAEISIAPIRWEGTAGQLIYLFEQAQANNFVSASMDLQATIKKHFVDSDGKPFNSLKQSKQNYLNSKTGKPKAAGDIESMFQNIKDSE